MDFPPTKIFERYDRNELAVALEMNCEIEARQFRMLALVSPESGVHVFRNISRSGAVNQQHFSVLIDNVEIVNNQDGGFDRIGGVVRLEPFDKVEDFGICNSLYCSLIRMNFVFIDRLFLKDRKLDFLGAPFPVFVRRENPDHMVQTGSQLVDDLASQHTQTWWNDQILMVMESIKEQLFIVLGENWVLAFLKEPGDFHIEIANVLVGPF